MENTVLIQDYSLTDHLSLYKVTRWWCMPVSRAWLVKGGWFVDVTQKRSTPHTNTYITPIQTYTDIEKQTHTDITFKKPTMS